MGEVIPIAEDFVVPSLRGDITVSDQSLIDVSGEGGGHIFIRSGQFFANNSMIKADTLGSQQGYGIDIKVGKFSLNESEISSSTYGEGNSGPISIEADNISLNDSWITSDTEGEGLAGPISIEASNISLNYSGITSDTLGDGDANQVLVIAKNNITLARGEFASGTIGSSDNIGNAGKIVIRANELVIIEGGIYSETSSQGNAGQILIEVNNLWIDKGGKLYTTTENAGNAGHININATGIITVIGASVDGSASRIESGSTLFYSVEDLIGRQGGHILIETQELVVKDGGFISVSSIGQNTPNDQSGHITLQVKGAITLAGVNPYGENEEGFGAGLYARSIGENAGNGGQIELSAGLLTLQNGAVIESSTNNNAAGGNIKIHVNGPVHISGDASQIELLAPASTQEQYLEIFSPRAYNQSTSGIYANSNSSSEQAGLGGNITLTAQSLIMINKGRISTTSVGGGQAGTITITVDQLQLDNTAKIASESQLINTFDKETDQFVSTGDIVEITEDGKVGTRLSWNNSLIVIAPSIKTVANLAELDKLSSQYNLVYGQVVEVKNIGNSQSARFIYAKQRFLDSNLGQEIEIEKWFQFTEQNTITLENQEALLELYSESSPYPNGTVIKVNNNEDGKSATFVYTIFSDSLDNITSQQITGVIEPLTVANVLELQQVSEQISLAEGTRATVLDSGDGTKANFIYYYDWLKLGTTHKVANVTDLNNLQFAQTGNVTHVVIDGQTLSFIYSGREWLPLNSDEFYTVQNLTELNKLPAKTGDLVAVVDAGNGQYTHFFYAEGEWKKQIRGGDAGKITINANSIQLSNGSEISTGSISGGGGSVTLNVDKMVFINNSEVSTSVQEGVGNGGDLSLTPEFVILENGKIIARANEGQGGNININTTGIYTFPPESASSIDASSELGIDGIVHIESPDVDVSGALLAIPAEFFDASTKLISPCTIAQIQNPNTFIVKHVGGSAPLPSDWQSNQLVLIQPEDEQTPHSKTKKTSPITSLEVTEQLALKVALLTGCQSQSLTYQDTLSMVLGKTFVYALLIFDKE